MWGEVLWLWQTGTLTSKLCCQLIKGTAKLWIEFRAFLFRRREGLFGSFPAPRIVWSCQPAPCTRLLELCVVCVNHGVVHLNASADLAVSDML